MNRTIAVLLTANSAPLTSQLLAASRSVAQFDNVAKSAASSADRAGKIMGTALVAAGAAVAAGLMASVGAAAAFEREMLNVSTISKAAQDDFAGVSRQVLDLSRNLPQSATTLAKGLYEIASSSFDGAEGMSVLRTSAMAASAGLTTAEVAAKGITAVLNAYGMSGFEAARVSDILFQTVNKGVVTFEELSHNLGDFVGMAAAFGRNAQGDFIVPIEDASAALATMTLAGISAAEASTSLNRVLQSFIDPSEAMTAHLQKMGYESGVAAVEALGLQGAIDGIRVTTGGSVEVLVSLFNEIRAARGALALMANEGRNYQEVAAGISDENGRLNATQEAFNRQSQGMSFQLEVTKNNLRAMAIEGGQVLLPVLNELVQGVAGLFAGFSALPSPVKTVITLLAAGGAAAGLAAGGFLLLRPLVSGLATQFPLLAGAARGVVPALGPLGIALGIGAALLTSYGNEKREATELTHKFTEAILAETKGMEDSVAKTIAMELAKRGLVDAAEAVGISMADMIAAVRGDEEALGRVQRAFNETGIQGIGFAADIGKVADGHRRGTEAADQHRRAEEETNPAIKELRAAFASLGEISDEAAGEIDKMSRSVAHLGISSFDLARVANKNVDIVKAMVDAMNATGDSFRQSFDLIGGFAQVTQDRESALESLSDAEESYADAVASANERISAAQERAAESAERVTEAEERVAEAYESAADKVADAERNLSRAQERELEAQEALTQARIDAREELEELSETVERAALSEERAEIRLLEARERQVEVNGDVESSDLDRRKAALDVRDAELDLVDAQERRAEQSEELARLQAEGVEGTERVKDAQQELADAQEASAEAAQKLHEAQVDGAKAVAEAQKDVARAQRESAQAQQEVAKAQAEGTRRIADANLDLAGAMKAVEDADLKGFFIRQQEEARQFVENVQTAARQGLRPEFIAELLQAGPATAAPILSAIANDHTGELARLANDTYESLRKINEQAVYFQWLTQQAMRSNNEQMVRDLDEAMRIAEANMREGGKRSAEALAQELGMKVEDVRRIARDYNIGLLEGLNPILQGIGQQPIQSPFTSSWGHLPGITVAAEGTHLPDQAKYQPAGTLVQWAEPETGGEWFIPDSPQKRGRSLSIAEDMLDRWGYAIQKKEFAEGGFRTVDDVPKPPGYDGFGDMLGYTGREADRHAYEMVVDFIKKRMLGNGYGYQALIDYLSGTGVNFQVTSTLRPGAITASGHPSLHAAGLAADFAGDMWGIFRAFSNVAPALQELFFDPAGRSVKGGRWYDWTIGGHSDHVHAATWRNAEEGPGLPTGGMPGGADVPGGVRDWIRSGISVAGAPADWLEPGVRRAMYESGGDPRAINLWDCLPLRTLILTRYGWKSHDEVQVGDETLGFNPSTNRNEWTRITRVVHYDDAPTVRIGNKRWSVECTPNHRWWSEPTRNRTEVPESCPHCGRSFTPSRGNPLAVHAAKAHGRKLTKRRTFHGRFVKTQDFSSHERLRLAADADTGPGLPITDAEAAILGWVAGDGNVEQNRRGPSFSVVQVKDEHIGHLHGVFAGVPHAFYDYKKSNGRHLRQWRVTPAYCRNLLGRVGHPKMDAERMVLAMSPSQRAAWLDAMVRAEGGNGGVVVYQCDGPVADALKLAFYLSGFRPSQSKLTGKDQWSPCSAYAGCRPHVTSGCGWTQTEGPRQAVWCVTTELGSWTAQQDGQVFLTGNSNAAAGTPSKGLMQVIDPTFAAYHVPGYGDIWNPVDNSAAAFRYIRNRYGSIWEIDPPVSGYREGGFHHAVFDQGGWLMPGTTIAHNNTGRPERVVSYADGGNLPPEQGGWPLRYSPSGQAYYSPYEGFISAADGSWVPVDGPSSHGTAVSYSPPMPSSSSGDFINYDRLAEALLRVLESRPVEVHSYAEFRLNDDVLGRATSRALEHRRRDYS